MNSVKMTNFESLSRIFLKRIFIHTYNFFFFYYKQGYVDLALGH